MINLKIIYEDLLVRGWGKEGFVEAFGAGVSVEKIAVAEDIQINIKLIILEGSTLNGRYFGA